MINNIFFNSAPPLNLSIEIMPNEYIYFGIKYETINCTAAINPNTTVLSLVGKAAEFLNEYIFAEQKNVKTFVDSESIIDCYPTVRTVFSELGNFLAGYNWVGCLANDSVSGQNPISEFKTVSVLIIH